MKKTQVQSSAALRTLAVVVTFICFGITAAMADDVTVLKGASTRIPAPGGVKKISIADPSIVDAKPSEDGMGVVVNGLSQGSSEVRIELQQGADIVDHVTVRSDLQGTLDEIKELLSDVDGLEMKIVGDKIVLKGNIATQSGYTKKSKVVAAYSSVILDLSSEGSPEIDGYVKDAILRDIGMDTVTARVMGDTVVLEGVVYSEADRARAVEMAKLRRPNVRDLLQVQEVMIETDVQFVKVSSDYSQDIGNNLLGSASFAGAGAFSGAGTGKPKARYALAGAIPTVKINASLGNADSKILAQPHLTTKSGAQATFQSGGQTYFTIAGNVGGSLQSVDYGVILTVKPTLQGKDRILTDITVEVSVPSAKSQGGALSLDKFQTKSTVLCKTGESVIISGLMQMMTSHFKDKTPLLGDIPLLNLFFAESKGDKSKDEMLLVVTPVPSFPQAATGPALSEERQKSLEETKK